MCFLIIKRTLQLEPRSVSHCLEYKKGEKTMKKFRTLLCILLAVAMVLSFAACGKKTEDDTNA